LGNGRRKDETIVGAFLSLLEDDRATGVAWTADITYWMDGRRAAGLANPEWDSERGHLELHRELGISPYYYYEKFWVGEPKYDTPIEHGSETTDGVTTHFFRTPVGELTERTVYSPISCSVGCAKHFVETEADLDVLLYILEHRSLAPANLADYAERRALWRVYDGLPSLGMPRSPLPSFCCDWAGVQNAAYLIADCPEKVERIVGLLERQEAPVLAAVREASVPWIHFPDNLSSANLTSFYDRFMAGPHRRRIRQLHEAGTRCAVHLDGTVRGLLPKLIDSGFDAIEALTPKPVGDMTVEEIQAVAREWPGILWGGLPGAMFAPPFTWEDMKAQVESVLAAWGGRRFVLSVGDQVPPNGDIEFCGRIAELVGWCAR
jgi:hypothetical protein